MKKKGLIVLSLIAFICILMYAEYRYIMTHQVISKVNDDFYQITIFNQIDEYYVE